MFKTLAASSNHIERLKAFAVSDTDMNIKTREQMHRFRIFESCSTFLLSAGTEELNLEICITTNKLVCFATIIRNLRALI